MDTDTGSDHNGLLIQLVELAFEPIFAWRPDRGIITWNSGCERLYGYSREEAIGRISHDLLNTRFPVSREEFEAQLYENRVWSGELRHTAKDARELVVESRLQLLHVDGQNLVLEANRDISERKRAEEALRKSEEALRIANNRKDQFLAMLAHELRNPLAPIRTGVDILKRERERLTPNSGAVIDIMDRQTAHLVRLVDDLLEVSRIAQGKFEFRMQLCDLMDILGTALEACQGNIERKNHSLTTDFSESKLPVLADPIRLAQAFTNVLNNAAKFTRPGGAIRVSAKPSDGYAVVTIADSGVGIPKTALTDIFELFTQLDQPSERNSGLGIGLTLVRDILEAHGGTVEAASAGPNAGSIFTLRVPLAQTATRPDTSKPSAHSGIAPPKRVLVIDDNHDAADLLSKLLESFGATVRVAYDGRTGLAAAEDFCPDIVFIDLGMPGLNGFETAHLLREGARGKQLFIAAITGWGQKDDRAQTAAAGFNAHLIKPASVEALKEVLVSSAPDKP